MAFVCNVLTNTHHKISIKGRKSDLDLRVCFCLWLWLFAIFLMFIMKLYFPFGKDECTKQRVQNNNINNWNFIYEMHRNK